METLTRTPEVTFEDEGVERFGYRQELRRTLSFRDLLVYGLIFMVPIAPFGIFGSVFSASGGMVALAYVDGLIGMAFTALSYARWPAPSRRLAPSTATPAAGCIPPSASLPVG